MSHEHLIKNHTLLSKYTKNVNRNLPLNDYPRPAMVRDQWINLNGSYQYAILEKDLGYPEAFQGTILVPFCVESQLSGVNKPLKPTEKLWYLRQFNLEVPKSNETVILHFGAIDYESEVFINQKFIGKHIGGYLPFSYDISNYLHQGVNELVISVSDPTDTSYQERGKQSLNPKGIWYTATSGIWQTVWMEIVPKVRIDAVKMIPDVDQSKIRINPLVRTDLTLTAKVTIFDQKKMVHESVITVNTFTDIILKNVKLWSPESPFLYDVKLELLMDQEVIDTIKTYFGMRKISIGTDKNNIPRIYLNNKPYFQTGVLDQGYFPDGLLTPPTDQAMIDDIIAMKNLGFNMLRKHIKIEPERWYYHCDRLGMIVWQDMPSGGDGYLERMMAVRLPFIGIHINDRHHRLFHRQNFQGRQEFESNLQSMLNHLFNHPSICCWVPFNEGWGQFDAKRISENIKRFDPSRLVDHASGWHDQGGKDFISLHRYIYEIKPPRKMDGRPFVISEFGGYSQIIKDHTWDEATSFGYKMYETKAFLSDAYEALIREQVLPLVKKGLSATIYTQLSDVELEVNGLITYDREIVKLESFMVKSLNEQLQKELSL